MGDDGKTKSASHFEESLEMVSAEAEKRRRLQRQWLRHKQRMLREEEELVRRRQAKVAKTRQRAATTSTGLRDAILSQEEQSRYAAMVSTVDDQGSGTAGASL